MVRTVERIEQELAILDQSVATIAQEFHDTYNQYLRVLGQAVRQQLILASYHLCTQGYPERFLKLSLSQRQQLQQGLRHLAKQAQTQILDRLQPVQASDDVLSLSAFPEAGSMSILVSNRELFLEEIVLPDEELLDKELDKELDEESDDEENQDSNQSFNHPLNESLSSESLPSETPFPDASPSETPLTPPDSTSSDRLDSDRLDIDPESYLENPEHSESPQNSQTIDYLDKSDLDEFGHDREKSQTSEPESPSENTEPKPLHPRHIARWQERMEAAIVEELQTLSHAANRLLQQSQILPGRLPEPVLEVAARADISAEATASPPNLLNLMVETENGDQKESTMTQLMAIHLRLSEIEFSDSSTMIWRSKIRELLAKLSRLGREYQKKQKEHKIAQAEAAWRSSWYED